MTLGGVRRYQPRYFTRGCPLTLVLFLAGIILLIAGAELLIRGASRIAVATGITPLIVGLTVVAFGTSSPELAVSVNAALAGQADISVGNIVGSNIFNVLFVLGLSAIIAPLVVSQQLIRLDVPIMIAASLLAYVLAHDGRIGRLDGFVLIAGSIAYIVMLIRVSRRESANVQAAYDAAYGAGVTPETLKWGRQVLLIGVGLTLLVVGSFWLVNGAVAFARMLGVSELIVGLTIVAAGTSLPEVATSVIAGFKGERDIAIGNVVGSNIFNLLLVLGITAVISQNGLAVATPAINFDFPVMVATAVLCLPIFFVNMRIGRWEGSLFAAYYVLYTLYLILATSQHDALPEFSAIMLFIVIPFTVVTVTISFVRELKRRGPG